MKRKIFKITGIAALVFILFFAGAVVWIKLFFPVDKVRRLVESTIEETTGRECSVGQVGVSFRWGFAVNLSRIEVASHPDETSPYFFRTDNLYLRFRLLPLLMRRVEVTSLSVLRPEIYLVRDKDGSLNLTPTLEKKPGEVKEKPREEPGFSLLLLAVSVEDATLHYLDQASGLEIAFGPLDARFALSGLKDSQSPAGIAGRARLEGIRSASSQAFNRLGAFLPLQIDLSASLADSVGKMSFQQVSLESLALDFNGIRLAGTGRLSGMGTDNFGYSVSLEGATDELAPLIGVLDESGKPGGMVKELEGRIQLTATLESSPGAERGAEFVLKAGLEDLAASVDGLPWRVSGLNGELILDKSQLKLENIEARIGRNPLSLDGRILIEQDYPFSLHLQVPLELDDLPLLIPALDGWQVAGKIEADLRLAGLLENITGLYADGTLTGENLAFKPPQGGSRLEMPGVYFSLSGHDIEKGEIELFAGGSRLNLRAAIRNYTALLFQEKMDPSTASWTLDAAGASLSLSDFFPADSVGGEKDGEKQSALKNYNLPFSLGSGSGTLKAGKLAVTPEIALDSVELAFSVRDSLINIQRLNAGLFSGRLTGGGSIALGKTDIPGYGLDLVATRVNASELLNPFSKLGNYLTGEVSTGLRLDRRKGGEKALDSNITGNVEFTLHQGRLAGWPALQNLARLTKIEELNDLAIEQWIGSFQIRDERVYADDLEMGTTVSDLLVSGSVGFDGSLDYSLALVLSEDLTRKYRSKLPGEIASLLTGNEDKLELNFTIGGTTEEPGVNWDTRPVARRLSRKLGSQLNKLIDRLLPFRPKDTDTSETADSAEAQPKDEPAKDLPGFLRKLLKKKEEPK